MFLGLGLGTHRSLKLSGQSGGDIPEPVARPVATTAPVISGLPRIGETLTATAVVWESAEPIIDYIRVWRRDGVQVAEGDTLQLASAVFSAGDVLTYHEQARNQGGWSAVASSAPVTIQAIPVPTTAQAPEITGTPQLGEVLSASMPTWSSDAEILETELVWLRAGVTMGSGQTLELDDRFTAGDVLHAMARARNAGGWSDAALSEPVTVLAVPVQPPTTDETPAITGTPQMGETLSGAQPGWSSTHAILEEEMVWHRNGAPLSTGPTLTLEAPCEVGDAITLECRARNEGGWSAPATSAPVILERAVTNPDPPRNLVFDAVTTTGFQVLWDAPVDDGGAEISSYELSHRKLPDGAAQVVIGANSPHLLSDLDPGSEYAVEVTALNQAGFRSLPASATQMTDIEVPAGPSADILWSAEELISPVQPGNVIPSIVNGNLRFHSAYGMGDATSIALPNAGIYMAARIAVLPNTNMGALFYLNNAADDPYSEPVASFGYWSGDTVAFERRPNHQLQAAGNLPRDGQFRVFEAWAFGPQTGWRIEGGADFLVQDWASLPEVSHINLFMQWSGEYADVSRLAIRTTMPTEAERETLRAWVGG